MDRHIKTPGFKVVSDRGGGIAREPFLQCRRILTLQHMQGRLAARGNDPPDQFHKPIAERIENLLHPGRGFAGSCASSKASYGLLAIRCTGPPDASVEASYPATVRMSVVRFFLGLGPSSLCHNGGSVSSSTSEVGSLRARSYERRSSAHWRRYPIPHLASVRFLQPRPANRRSSAT